MGAIKIINQSAATLDSLPTVSALIFVKSTISVTVVLILAITVLSLAFALGPDTARQVPARGDAPGERMETSRETAQHRRSLDLKALKCDNEGDSPD